MKILGVIPARFASTRLPGKPLALIGDQPMILRVYNQALLATQLDDLVIATDDARILKVVEEGSAKGVLTKTEHASGTERIIEVMERFKDYDAFVNIQGDEPFIEPENIDKLCLLLKRHTGNCVATLCRKSFDEKEIQSKHTVKVVTDVHGTALYFSRAAIPFSREGNSNQPYLVHIGLYGYMRETLQKIKTLSPTPLESTESLEQLRWLENNIPIYTSVVSGNSISVDSPEDLEMARSLIKKYTQK